MNQTGVSLSAGVTPGTPDRHAQEARTMAIEMITCARLSQAAYHVRFRRTNSAPQELTREAGASLPRRSENHNIW